MVLILILGHEENLIKISSQDEALAAMASQEKNHVPSWSAC